MTESSLLLGLPTELVHKIATFDTTEVFPVVCSTFNQVYRRVSRPLRLDGTVRYWVTRLMHADCNSLVLGVPGEHITELLDQHGFIPDNPRFPRLRKLQITSLASAGNAVVDARGLASLVNLDRVQRLWLQGVQPDSVLGLLNPDTCVLSELTLHMRNNTCALPHAITRRLTKLSVIAKEITGYRGAFGPNLRALHLSASDMPDDLLEIIADQCPVIQKIYGVWCPQDTLDAMKTRHPHVYRALAHDPVRLQSVQAIEAIVGPGRYIPTLCTAHVIRSLATWPDSEAERLLCSLRAGRLRIKPRCIRAMIPKFPQQLAYDLAAPLISAFSPPAPGYASFWRWTYWRCYTLSTLIGRSYTIDSDRIDALIRQCLKHRRTAATVALYLLRGTSEWLDLWIDNKATMDHNDTVILGLTYASCALLLMLPLEPHEKAHVEVFVECTAGFQHSATAEDYIANFREVIKHTCETPEGIARITALCEDD